MGVLPGGSRESPTPTFCTTQVSSAFNNSVVSDETPRSRVTIPYTQLGEFLQDFEEKHDLLHLTIDGWSFWPIFRLPLGFALSGLNSPAKERMGRAKMLRMVGRDLPTFINPPFADLVVLTLNSARTEQVGRHFKDIFFDDLLVGRDGFVKIEELENRAFLSQSRKALVPSLLSTVPFRFFSTLLSKVGWFPAHLGSIANRISQLIRSELGLSEYTNKVVRLRLARFYLEKRFYRVFLARVRPRTFLHIGCHFYEALAAAKELGIRTVEFQHGFVDRKTHFGYSWGRYAAEYKRRMPVPDQFFLYGDYWRDELAADGFWGDSLRVVGSLRMDDYRLRRDAGDKGPGAPTVLWTSDGVEVDKAADFMARVLEELGPEHPVRLAVKLHPHSENRKEPYFNAFHRDPRVEIFLGSEAPSTFELLTRAHLHVSIASTCHYEAIGLGVPTVILPLASHEKVLALRRSGYAFLTHQPSDLAALIRQWKTLAIPNGVGEIFFRSNALENIRQELGLI